MNTGQSKPTTLLLRTKRCNKILTVKDEFTHIKKYILLTDASGTAVSDASGTTLSSIQYDITKDIEGIILLHNDETGES